ncbi:putative importin alpha re-exporter [Xylona heveae TC161]|uniref:Putative importin alpha re-exporter n=1 Tax=Xylona heveae (strain CBS 132557 / TC161) TaxID=1328760 RepID=A0A165FTR5_XYLHT|nr:putative importin alpha re-exporter [Xylona heveae TC161]KZF21366.1 putative importin alpha re-exporter [Xylona heveae TC161]
MAANLQAVVQLLDATLDPRQQKQAEQALLQQDRQPGFSLSILQIVANNSFPYTSRLAAALFFKNFIRRNWTDEEGNYKLPQNEVIAIKQELIGLMISVEPAIQAQLGDAISVIADSDFWERWDTLVDDLVSRLTPDNAVTNNGVLQVAHSIFKRWRPLFRSDDLFTEINHVLGKFGGPFLSLFESTDALIEQNKDNKAALQQHFATLNLMIKLFYDLSCQDLPPVFEDHLPAITTLLHKYLTYDNPLLHSDDESESGPLEFVKAGIFEALVLYVQKYEDAFGPLLGPFVESSWVLLTTIGPETKYDILVSKALHFLTSVARISHHAQNFNNEGVLGQVVEKVILPNLSLRESDEELFEDEPIEFIRRDLEGSDSDTRRRASTDFLRQLMEQFEALVTAVVSRYVEHYLADYAKDTSANWKSKDTAVYLFSAIAAKGATTSIQGVKTTNQLVDIVDFFQKNVASDLTGGSAVQPILKVGAIKYLYTFRSQMTKEQWQSALPLLVQHLAESDYVVYTYAAIVLERVLVLTTETREPIFGKAELQPLSKDLLEHLFQLIEKDAAPEKIQENEFLMKCVMRVLIVIRDGVVPIADSVMTHLINITQIISANPSNPRFYYYHFESIGALIRFAAPTQPEKMENAFYGPFATVLQNDVQEFMPYVFQLFAALLEANPSGSLSDYYKSLISPILMPPLWESKGNVPALVRLLSSIIARAAEDIAKGNQIEPILGIFQKLVSTKVNESYGFDLLECVVEHLPVTALQQYFVPMVQIMLTRLQSSKTENFALRFVRFYHFISALDDKGLGADFFINVTEQIQAGVFTPVYISIILPETQKLARPLDRKTAVVSFTKTLSDSVAFVEKYKKGWAYTCEALLKLLENPPLPVSADDTILDQDVDDVSFGVGFTALNTCKKAPTDPWPEISDVKKWVGLYLRQADAKHGGRISVFAQERLSPEARQVLAVYMQG